MNNLNIHTGEDMPINTKASDKKKYQLKIDNDVHSVNSPEVSRINILALANMKPECRFEVYQELNPHKELELVREGQIVTLSGHGTEKFITKKIEQVTYYLCDEPVFTSELFLTPALILQQKFKDKAGQYYLKQIVGQTQISYEGKSEEKLTMCPDLKFLYIFTGPMTVS
jgi:hypothetical protein